MIPRALLAKIRRLEIRTKGLVSEMFSGQYRSAFKGRGVEFAEVRLYQPGDDVRTIDWNVSARTGETFVKRYEEEREQTLLLAVDVSGSEDFGSGGQAKRQTAAELCAVLAFAALQNSDKVGLLLFTDGPERFVRPRKSRRHVLRLIRDLFAHAPASRGTDVGAACEHLMRVLKRRAIILLVSDFLDTPRRFAKPLRKLSQKHDVVAVHLRDPREMALPNVGLVTLRDAETGRAMLLDTGSARARAAYADRAARQQAALEDALRSAQVDTIEIDTHGDIVEPLITFFNRRTRR